MTGPSQLELQQLGGEIEFHVQLDQLMLVHLPDTASSLPQADSDREGGGIPGWIDRPSQNELFSGLSNYDTMSVFPK